MVLVSLTKMTVLVVWSISENDGFRCCWQCSKMKELVVVVNVVKMAGLAVVINVMKLMGLVVVVSVIKMRVCLFVLVNPVKMTG